VQYRPDNSDGVSWSVKKHDHSDASSSFDLLQGMQAMGKSKPRSLVVPVTWRGRQSARGIESGELLQLSYAKRRDEQATSLILPELDNETETVEPGREVWESARFWRSSSILRKNVIYAQAFRNPDYKVFGFSAFRVLYLTLTEGHMEKMIQCERDFLADQVRPGFFLYANSEMVFEHKDDILAMPWLTRTGKEWRLNQ